jgi:eukaryotic-like serine/threonine-protein kinase
MITSSAALVQALDAHALLEPSQLDQLRQSQQVSMDPRSLAGLLLRQGWLTAYQVNQLFAGSANGLVLGHYALLERLGSGSMGQVYKARHQRLGQIVALKVILKEYLAQPTALPRFRREIQVAAQLNHPNIVKAFDADVIDGTPFYTMEFCDGINLAKRVMRSGPMPIKAACECVRQAALGLQHAFEKGIVHRDVKPSNILLTRSAELGARNEENSSTIRAPSSALVKLLDLGLAFVPPAGTDTSSMRDLTNPHLFVGTPDFAAPEQATDPHHVDTRCDLYSLGCTFYFLLTGIVPFPYGTALNKLFRHRFSRKFRRR